MVDWKILNILKIDHNRGKLCQSEIRRPGKKTSTETKSLYSNISLFSIKLENCVSLFIESDRYNEGGYCRALSRAIAWDAH